MTYTNNLNIMCPIGHTGYGISSMNMLRSLSEMSNISLFCLSNLNNIIPESQEDIDLLNLCLKNSSDFDYKAPCLKIWHAHDLALRAGSGPYHCYTFFELDKISDKEKHDLNSCDNVFVASAWAKKVLLDSGVSCDITPCPLGVDTNIFKPNDNHNDKYIFYNIGKWEHRKSHDILLKCFEKSFTEKDDVELWLFPHNPFLSAKETRYWLNMVDDNKLSEKIKIFPRFSTQTEMYNIVKNANCGVFCSRAEGWNNGVIESMSMNKPVIVTNYSAHTEYCNSENSYLVEINDVEPAVDNKWFHGEGNWAKMDTDQENQIIEFMRKMYNNKVYDNKPGLETAAKYSWNNTATIIKERIFNHANTRT